MKTRQNKKPWPTKEAMQQVYKKKLWGDNGATFYSGEGSHHPKLVDPYIEIVSSFLKSFKKPMKLCDLGCGDFNIGKQLLPYVKEYLAVDIVQELIDYNSKRYKYPNLEFQCLDISKDILPTADIVLLRQVLQHLSNAEVKQVVEKLSRYQYVILTEHLPHGEFIPNKDIISGQGIRLKKQSGLNLLKSPFCLKPKVVKLLLRQNTISFGGWLVTYLYRIY